MMDEERIKDGAHGDMTQRDDVHHFGYEAGGARPHRIEEQERALPQTVPQWSVQHAPRKRFGIVRTVMASFVSGALVVGGLMWASDQYGWFTQGDGATRTIVAGVDTVAVRGSGGVSTLGSANDIVRPGTIPQLVEMASPAVVKIETYAKKQASGRSFGFADDFFKDFFGEYFDMPEETAPEGKGGLQQVGSGSGFFFDASGYILTNEHVIHGADEVRVVVDGVKEAYTAKVLGTAYETDLAVIKIEGKTPFPVLRLADSERIRVGDWVVAIGNPYEFDHTVTVGVLSAKERTITIPDDDGTRRYQTLLQTDASINPGNSGGPLLNLQGEVIGINTAVNAQAQGIGFAIPTSTISSLLESLKANKPIPRPFIGVRMANVPENYVSDLGLPNKDGAFINEVVFGSPAYKAGVQVYDVVIAMDGKPIKTSNDLQKAVGLKKPGDKIVLSIFRNKVKTEVTVVVGDMNTQKK